jgi:hypothetical protein
MNANTPDEALKIINKAYNKQKQQVEEMYAFFNDLINILSTVDAKSNDEVQQLAWSIRTALMTYMLRLKSIGEKE